MTVEIPRALKANPELAGYITSLIGSEWVTDLSELKKLEK